MVVYCWCRRHLHPPLYHYHFLHLPHLESQSRQLDWHILPQCYWLWRHITIVTLLLLLLSSSSAWLSFCTMLSFSPILAQLSTVSSIFTLSLYYSCCASCLTSAHMNCVIDRTPTFRLLSSVGIFHSMWLPLPFSILSSVKTRRFLLLYLRLLWSLPLLLSLIFDNIML